MYNKLLTFISVIVFLCSCSVVDNERTMSVDEETVELIESVFYHQPSGLYLKHQNDPFSLANMQAAYDKVVTTKGEGGFFQQGGKLSPTHFALKMYPRTQKEWSAIDNMDDIKVSYYPFDYTPVPGEVISEYCQNSPFEVSKYSETYTYKSTDSFIEKEETISLPVLYVVWPADKELPKEYDYVVDYGVFIPSYAMSTKAESGLSLSEKRALEQEALVLALGEKILLRTKSIDDDSANVKVLTGSVSCFDSTYFGLLPLPNIGMKFALGTFIYDTSANELGTFDITIDTEYHPYLNFSFYFKGLQYEVRLSDSASYYQVGMGTVENVFGSGTYGHRDFDLSNLPTLILHAFRAARYYYKGSHEITKYYPGTRIVIKTYNQQGPGGVLGRFCYTSDNNCYIEIYKHWPGQSSICIGTTLHELGHYLHFGLVGYSIFNSTQLLVTESFSSFVGWSLGHKYYQQYNYYLTSGISDGTGNGNQTWLGPSSAYSPLFVDLQDTYNQSSFYSSFVNDTISGVPYSVIQSIISSCTSWITVRNALSAYVNTYYSQSDFNSFVALYGN